SAVIRIAHADDLVPRRAARGRVAVIEVHEAVARKARIESDPEQALLTIAAGACRDRGPQVRAKPAARSELHDAHAPGALGDEESKGAAGDTGERVARVPLTGRVTRRRRGRGWSGPVGERATPTPGQDPRREPERHTRAARHSLSCCAGIGGAMRNP